MALAFQKHIHDFNGILRHARCPHYGLNQSVNSRHVAILVRMKKPGDFAPGFIHIRVVNSMLPHSASADETGTCPRAARHDAIQIIGRGRRQ